jgi:hypothetical protein
MECKRTDDVQRSSQVGNDQDQIYQGQGKSLGSCERYKYQTKELLLQGWYIFLEMKVKELEHFFLYFYYLSNCFMHNIVVPSRTTSCSVLLPILQTEFLILKDSLITLSKYFMLFKSLVSELRFESPNISFNSFKHSACKIKNTIT